MTHNNLRDRQLAWIDDILTRRRWSLTKLAQQCGLATTTLTRWHGASGAERAATLGARSVDKITRTVGQAPYTPDAGDSVDSALQLLAGERSTSAWQVTSRAVELRGLVPGDVILVETDASCPIGGVALAEVAADNTQPAMMLRVFEPPMLIPSATGMPSPAPFLVDDRTVRVIGPVIATLRPRPCPGGRRDRDRPSILRRAAHLDAA